MSIVLDAGALVAVEREGPVAREAGARRRPSPANARRGGRRAGVLLGSTRTADVIDAALVLLAAAGDVLVTSDPADLVRLTSAAGIDADVVSI